MQLLHILRLCLRVVADAYDHFNTADGWAIASHIALSILLALFPFLILVTSLAASFVPNVSDVPAPRLEPAHRLVVEREEA